MPPHPLSNFEIQKYYENKLRFNGVYSRNYLPKKIKDGVYLINLDEYADVGTHSIALYSKNIEIIYFDSFGVEHVPKELKKIIGHKNIKANIFRIHSNSSIMCGYFCIEYVTRLFSPYDFKENGNIILSYFKDEWSNWYF